tara:strand:- start:689 stop:1084 length:396 start_codon:yes stop_codon:yes gene_type:complete
MSVLRDKAILKWLNSQRDEAILEWLQGQLQVVNGIEDISTLIADASSQLDELSHSVFENWDVRTSECHTLYNILRDQKSSLEATEKKLRVSLSTFQHDALATQFEKVANLIRKVSPPGFPRPTNTKIKKEK